MGMRCSMIRNRHEITSRFRNLGLPRHSKFNTSVLIKIISYLSSNTMKLFHGHSLGIINK